MTVSQYADKSNRKIHYLFVSLHYILPINYSTCPKSIPVYICYISAQKTFVFYTGLPSDFTSWY